MTTKMIYRGSYPAPKHEHGDNIPGYGIVKGRSRLYSGWEYSCISTLTPITIYYFEWDTKKQKE